MGVAAWVGGRAGGVYVRQRQYHKPTDRGRLDACRVFVAPRMRKLGASPTATWIDRRPKLAPL